MLEVNGINGNSIWGLLSCLAALLAVVGCGDGVIDDDDDPPAPATGVILNELLASNDAVLADEAGEFDDWFELYNRDSEAFDLSGWSISGGPVSDTAPWVVPGGVSVPALGFLVIWADDDPEQGDLHTDFKLARVGETLILYGEDAVEVDRVTFPEQQTDRSWGRLPDATGDWQQLSAPSPAQSN